MVVRMARMELHHGIYYPKLSQEDLHQLLIAYQIEDGRDQEQTNSYEKHFQHDELILRMEVGNRQNFLSGKSLQEQDTHLSLIKEQHYLQLPFDLGS